MAGETVFDSALDAGYTPMQSAGLSMLPPGYTSRLFQLESGGNPNAQSGSYRGLGQFGPAEEKQYGITDYTDPNQQATAVAREAQTNAPALSKALGRAPTAGELYLTHQQGIAGGPALLTADPGTPAWQAIRPYYKSDAAAQKAITGNIPKGSALDGLDVDKVTAGNFSKFWVSKFEGGQGQPTQVAQAQPSNAAPAQAPSSTASAEATAAIAKAMGQGGQPVDFSKFAAMLNEQPDLKAPEFKLSGPTIGAQYMRAAFDPRMALRQKIIQAITGGVAGGQQ